MEKNKQKNNSVLYISLAFSLAIVAWGIFAQANFAEFANNLLAFLSNNFGWAYLISMFIFVAFSLYLAFSKYGNIKLGADDSEPEFSTTSWFAMLFGAGMGIGLVFWGLAEPVSHFVAPMAGIEPGSEAAINFAMKSSFMHWGFHPWANYAIIGLSLAYFQFRKSNGEDIDYVSTIEGYNYPTPADVRYGVEYKSGLAIGTCHVPTPDNVRKNIPVDNTVGTSDNVNAEDILEAIQNSSLPIAQRLRNVATVESTGAQLEAYQ